METPLVLVTGVSGFIASWVAHAALKAGYRVRGTVRSLANEQKVHHLRDLCPGSRHRIELVEADLTSDIGWDDAVRGCTYILHVASPCPLEEPKDPNELIRPAVDGTLRVLRAAARQATVPKRVVVTSSVTAISYGQSKCDFSDDDWTDCENPGIPVGAYTQSKTLAERAAWDFVAGLSPGKRFELAAVNPSVVLGPMLSTSGCSSADILRQLAMAELPAIPDIDLHYVSVFDVARTHLLAMTNPGAAGKRFLCSSSRMNLREVGAIVAKELKPHGYRGTTAHAPRFVIRVLGFFGDKVAKSVLPFIGLRHTMTPHNARRILRLELRQDPALILQMLYAAIHANLIPDKSKGRVLTARYTRPEFDCTMIPVAP